ncbi:HtaA domain-containing protein [Corynebacterium renale]|uniref:Htaa protein n=1 Tax=Corynebacterium renale TaxID=1724 RepID=A0A2A9DMW4_9CORY|nr:HtaA domain-containing protein [Corynebacterium renale]PFG27721.1 Htaa protein [Corynebacterium renale]SQI22188.1 putative cell-surface hemin receptor [Corynebacterium renale]
MKKCALMSACAVAAATLTVPFAATATAQTCTYTVESGTLDWGVKQSFRNYIAGPIANGKWDTTGNVTQHGVNKKGSDFYFQFQVNPSASKLVLDGTGNIQSADIRTSAGAVDFMGHHGALATYIGSPYLTSAGNSSQVGISYEGYYVPGKGMTEYTPDDRKPENLRSGQGYIAKGGTTVSVSGDTVTLKTTGVEYVQQSGTDSMNGIVQGADIAFLGMYATGAEMDDLTITLKTKSDCGSMPNAPGDSGQAGKPGAPGGGGDTGKPDQSSQTDGSSAMATGWNWVLGIGSLLGMAGVLGVIARASGLVDGLQSMFKNLRR